MLSFKQFLSEQKDVPKGWVRQEDADGITVRSQNGRFVFRYITELHFNGNFPVDRLAIEVMLIAQKQGWDIGSNTRSGNILEKAPKGWYPKAVKSLGGVSSYFRANTTIDNKNISRLVRISDHPTGIQRSMDEVQFHVGDTPSKITATFDKVAAAKSLRETFIRDFIKYFNIFLSDKPGINGKKEHRQKLITVLQTMSEAERVKYVQDIRAQNKHPFHDIFVASKRPKLEEFLFRIGLNKRGQWLSEIKIPNEKTILSFYMRKISSADAAKEYISI